MVWVRRWYAAPIVSGLYLPALTQPPFTTPQAMSV